LNLKGSKDLPQPVSQEVIGAWDPKRGPCCTATNFHIDLNGLPRSKWNKSAAEVFAAEFWKCHAGENYTLEYVTEAWLTRVIAIRTQYKLQQRNESVVKSYRVQRRRHQRKHEVRTATFFWFAHLNQSKLYTRRLETAYEYQEIKDRAVTIVESLGLDGMSSDESSHEGRKGEATYRIWEKRWRSRQVNDWLRMLDALHLRLRYSGKWQATAGAWPHFRSSGLEYSERPPVKGLPVDFYSADWYGKQDAFMKGQLKAAKQLGSLKVPAEHWKYVHLLFI